MLKKLAVILRGHKRTWDYVKAHQFAFFEQLAEHIDYYMVIWDIGSANYEELTNDFKNRNLKYLKLVPYESYGGVSQEHHIKFVIPKIFKEEYTTDQKYCAIIETRPDMAFNIINPDINPIMLINSLGIAGPGNVPGISHDIKVIQDTCFLYNSHTGILWSNRNIFDKDLFNELQLKFPHHHHNVYYEVANYLKLRSYNIPWFTTIMVRPTIINYNDNSKSFYENASDALTKWQNYSTFDECMNFCNEAKIHHSEYIEQIPNQPGVAASYKK